MLHEGERREHKCGKINGGEEREAAKVKMVKHTLVLCGPKVSGGCANPETLGRVLRLVQPAVRESVNMRFRHASRMRGRRPEWLRRASDTRITGITKGQWNSTRLHFEAPCLGDAAQELYHRGLLFDRRPDRNDTAFDLLGDVLLDIANQVRDSARFDGGLLRRIGRFGSLASHDQVESITVLGNRLPAKRPRALNARVSELARALDRQTPQPVRARICGRLHVIRASDKAFELALRNGAKVLGVWTGQEAPRLTDFLDQNVVVEGQAVFRVSGTLLRIDAEAMDPAGQADAFFSGIPKATTQRLARASLRQRQTKTTGANAIFGKWPGDETDEEILAALEELD